MIDRVIDLSHWNTVRDFKAVHAAGIRGVIHKATHGCSRVDARYAERVRPIRDAGLMHGAYHFGVGGDGLAQARHFLDTVQPDERTLLALDYEPNPKGGTMTRFQARDFVLHVYEATGRWPLFYSGHLIKDLLRDSLRDAVLANCPLWLAQYGPKPVVQPTWKTWTLWQYTDTGKVSGVTGHVDRNRFNGDLNALRALWGYPPLVL